MSLRVERNAAITLLFFAILIFTLNWKVLLSPLPYASTTQLLNGFGEEINFFTQAFSGYSTFPGLGASSSSGLPSLTTYGLFYLLYLFVKDANLAYRLWFVVVNLVMLYGTFYFFRKMLEVRSIAAILATITILIMPLNINALAQGSPAQYLVVPAFIAAMYYATRLFDKLNPTHLLGFTISTFFVGSYPPTYLLEVIAILLYAPFVGGLKNPKNIAGVLLRLIVLLIISTLAVGYYALPTVLSIVNGARSGFSYSLSPGQAVSTLIAQRSSYFPPNNFFGMDYGFIMYHDIRGYVSVPMKDLIIRIGYYFMPLLISLGLGTLILPSGKRKISLYFAAVYLVGVSLYAGANFPFLLLLLMKNLPIPFAVLRSAANAYPLVYLPIASMIALLSDHLMFIATHRTFQQSPKLKRAVVLITIFALFAIPVYCISTLASTGNFFATSTPVILPNDYQQVSAFLLPQLQVEWFRVAIPGLQGIYHTYWAPNNLWETSPFLNSGIPFIYEWYIQPEPLVAQAAFSVLDATVGPNYTTAEQIGIQSLLGLMSVKYVLVQCDIEGMCSNPSFNESQMLTKLGSTYVVRFQNMTLYQNPKYYPIVYIPNSLSLVNNDSRSWIRGASQMGQMNGYISLTSNATSFEYLKSYSSKQIGNDTLVFYPVRLLNSTVDPIHSEFSTKVITDNRPFIVVISNNFDPAFQAYVNNGSVASHFQINSFANAWLIIPKSELVEIRISYGQNPIFIYLILALFLFIISMLVLQIISRRHDTDSAYSLHRVLSGISRQSKWFAKELQDLSSRDDAYFAGL